MIGEYRIITAGHGNERRFEAEITALLNDGWVLNGRPFVSAAPFTLYQSLVRYSTPQGVT